MMPGFETASFGKNYWEKLREEEEIRIKDSLNNLKNMINSDPWITKQPKLENWAAFFDYKYMWWNWEIVTRKENGKYSVRIKKWERLPNWKEGWRTQKNGNNDTFIFDAKNKNAFNHKLWDALDTIIWKNRDRLPTTGWMVYDLLNPSERPIKKAEITERKNVKFDTQYEKQYWVKLIRDKSLNFYVVKKWEWLGIIKQKLQKIPEFSYLSDKSYSIPSDWKRNIHSFNTPNSEIKEWFYLPIPIKKEHREVSISSFKSKAKRVLNEMKSNKTYWEKVKAVLRNVNESEIVNVMAAYARSETSEDYRKFSDPIWSVELHRRETRYKSYSFSYFHILMEKAADHKTSGPWLRARKNLWLSEWDCYSVENACKLFLWYCFEKSREIKRWDDFFFKIRSLKDATAVAVKYNWDSSYWNKLWANVQHCKTIK